MVAALPRSLRGEYLRPEKGGGKGQGAGAILRNALRARRSVGMAKQKTDPNYKVIAENRRARFDYAIEDDVECGIILEGSEVKSLRANGGNIAESYAAVEDGELWLVNSYIAPYKQAKTFGHEERRRRKLLVSRKQLADMWNATQRKGMTLVPIVMYFNRKGIAKLKIGIAKGKKAHDKRETQAKRDWSRQKQRLLKDNR